MKNLAPIRALSVPNGARRSHDGCRQNEVTKRRSTGQFFLDGAAGWSAEAKRGFASARREPEAGRKRQRLDPQPVAPARDGPPGRDTNGNILALFPMRAPNSWVTLAARAGVSGSRQQTQKFRHGRGTKWSQSLFLVASVNALSLLPIHVRATAACLLGLCLIVQLA
jgi:hypothetical protein